MKGKLSRAVLRGREVSNGLLLPDLCDEYDVLGFETLNLRGMKQLWGRKISDLGFSQFMLIAEHVAHMRGKRVVKIDPWQPTSQTCSCCGHRQSIELRERWFVCEACGLTIGRDHNAGRNIRREAIALLGVGASTPSLEGVRRSNPTARSILETMNS